MTTTSSGKLLAIVAVGILVMMIAFSLLALLAVGTRPMPEQPLSPELREARTEEEEQSYIQLLNILLLQLILLPPMKASSQTRRSR